MKNATHSQIRRLLPLLILAGLASRASTVSAGQGVWTSNGPFGGDITALAIDPVTPATLYAGTGDGRGVFKSTDSGGSWADASTGVTGQYVQVLAIDPRSPATLYAATWGGVFKSIDGGGYWTAIDTGLTDTYVTTLAVDPTTPTTLYVGTLRAGMFKSTNAGESWATINTGLTSTLVVALAVDPSTPSTLYASTANEGGGVLKSTDGGGGWTAINTGLTNVTVDALVIDPSTPSTLYASTYSGAFKSTDGGGSWTAINTGLAPNQFVNALVIDSSTPATLYAGTYVGVFKSTNGGGSWTATNAGLTDTVVQALAIDPSAPGSLYAGSSIGGVFKSSSGGGRWTAASTGLESPVTAVAVDPSAPTTLYAGSYPNGSVFKSTDGGANWAAIFGIYSRLQALVVDPSSPDTLYAGTSSDFFYEYPGLYKSTDGGAIWAAYSALGSVYALVIDPSDPATLYAGTRNYRGSGGGVLKSTNGGGSWSAINTGLQLAPDLYVTYVSALAIDPSTPATLYAGTSDGGAFKSTDAGGSWAAINAGLTATRVNALVVDPSKPAPIYAGTDIGLFKSTNGGGSWAAANTGLTNLSVNALVINSTTPTTLYAGTGGGVFRSFDSGGSWASFNMGLPSLNVNALDLDSTGTTLYAGLADGGAWQLTTSAAGTVTALLPASAHSPGVNGAFYTTNVAVANTGSLAASFTLKFLGHDQNGSNGAERSFSLDPGESRTFVDVLGSVFDQTSNFGAIRITSNSSALDITSVTSTPGFGGTLSETIPATAFSDLIPSGSSRSILYIREGDGFRSNLILASGSFLPTDVDVALVSPSGETLATKTYTVPPNGMTQIGRVVRNMGVSGPVTGARLVLSSSTASALFTGVASVIDETTNDPTAVPAQPASAPGSAPFTWLLPASSHASGINGAFYTTNLAVANTGAVPASYTMKFLGHDQDGSGGPEQTFTLEAGRSVIYFDVLGSVFSQTSNFGAILITSDTPSLNILSVTSTPGFGGTLSQAIPAVYSSQLIPANTSRSIVYIREGDGFRSNLVLASNASVPTSIDASLVSPDGVTLATRSYSVPSNGMTQIDRVVRDMGVSGSVTGARLVLSSATPDAAFTGFVSVIDEVTNDATAVVAK